MPILNLSIPHRLPKEEAMYRMKRFFSDFLIQYSEEVDNVRELWQANRARFDLTIRGRHLPGTLEIKDREILMALEFPPESAAFFAHIEAHIRDVAEPILR